MGVAVALIGLFWTAIGFWQALAIGNAGHANFRPPTEAELLQASIYGLIAMLGLVVWAMGLIIRRLPAPPKLFASAAVPRGEDDLSVS